MPVPRSLRFLIPLMVLAHLAFTGARVTLSLFALSLQGSTFTVGVLMSLLAAVPMVMAVHVGRWTDRVGVRGPVAMALVAMVAGALLPWLWPRIDSLYVSSVLLGSGFMLVHVAINNGVGNVTTPDNRTRAFTFLALGFSTSSMLGPVIAGFAIDLVGHARTFLLLAGFPVIALALLAAIWKQSPKPPPYVPPPGGTHVLDLLRDKPMRAVFIVSGLLSMGWDMFTFMVPVQGARIGLSASTIGLIMGTFGVATFIVRGMMPWISQRFSEWQTLTAALVITAFVYYLFPLFTAVPVLLSLAFVLGLGLGSAQPMVMSLLHRVAPVGRTGEAVGVRTTLMNASHTALPLFFGGVGAALGTVPAFWALAVLLSAGGVFAGRHHGTVR
jgi:predicted MFS family arabinose efflux permease